MQVIDFHVWRNNPLNFLDTPLWTADGRHVLISAGMTTFNVVIGDERHTGLDIPEVCALLNRNDVGVGDRPS